MPHGWDGEAVTIRWTKLHAAAQKNVDGKSLANPERSDSEPEKQATRLPMVASLCIVHRK